VSELVDYLCELAAISRTVASTGAGDSFDRTLGEDKLSISGLGSKDGGHPFHTRQSESTLACPRQIAVVDSAKPRGKHLNGNLSWVSSGMPLAICLVHSSKVGQGGYEQIIREGMYAILQELVSPSIDLAGQVAARCTGGVLCIPA
jgi:hypothetical protein